MFRKSSEPFQIFFAGLIDRLVFSTEIRALDVTEEGFVTYRRWVHKETDIFYLRLLM